MEHKDKKKKKNRQPKDRGREHDENAKEHGKTRKARTLQKSICIGARASRREKDAIRNAQKARKESKQKKVVDKLQKIESYYLYAMPSLRLQRE